MKALMLASAILVSLSASADARDLFLLCHVDGHPHPGFNISVDFETSALTVYEQIRKLHIEARITSDYIEYMNGMYETRIDRKSGDWVASSYTGSTIRGSCQKTDDQQRLDENICCSVKPNKALCSSDGC